MLHDLSHMVRTIRGVRFPYPVMLAGGEVKRVDQLKSLALTEVIPEWGSMETDPSTGNGGADYWATYDENGNLDFAQNSKGIPNLGMGYVEKHAAEMLELYNKHAKPLVLNISGKGVDDTFKLMRRALLCGFRTVVVNGACPNKADQPILCDDTDAVSELFRRADEEIGGTDAAFLWKVSCGMRRPALAHNKKCVEESRVFAGIMTGNTIPNGLDFHDDGRPKIKTEKNNIVRGGVSGPAILPIALDHTAFCADGMKNGKVVIGCGGITSAKAAMKFFNVGAHMVQVHTAYVEAPNGPEFMQNLLGELATLLPIT